METVFDDVRQQLDKLVPTRLEGMETRLKVFSRWWATAVPTRLEGMETLSPQAPASLLL